MKTTRKLSLVLLSAAALSLGACQTTGFGQGGVNKQTVGVGSGALIGGLLGSQVGDGSGQLWATGAGVLLGALAGGEIGRSLDKADMVFANQANQQAHSIPVGESVNWNNPDTGNAGTVTATRDGYSSSGRYCREYQQTILVNGQEQSGYGTACQQPDGSWEIIS